MNDGGTSVLYLCFIFAHSLTSYEVRQEASRECGVCSKVLFVFWVFFTKPKPCMCVCGHF